MVDIIIKEYSFQALGNDIDVGLSETVKPLVFLACSIKSSLYYPLNSKTKPIIK